MSNDIVLPTPERMAKGDLVGWKATGRSMNQMGHDYALARGVINTGQWVICNRMRLCYEAAIGDLKGHIMRYGVEPEGKDVQDWLNNRITMADNYRVILRLMPHEELIVTRAICCYDMSLRDAARHLGKRRDGARQYFYDGIVWLDKLFSGGGRENSV